MTKKYKVTIVQNFSVYHYVEVEAEDSDAARDIANNELLPVVSMDDLEYSDDEIIDVEEL